MKTNRMLLIPALAGAALVLAACSFSGSLDVGPFPNEEPREVSARSVNDPAAVDVTVGANGSQLFLVNIPAAVADSDVVWFEVREASGVESIMLYDVSALGQERERLTSVGAGWFDVPGSVTASPSSQADLGPAQGIVIRTSCAGPCVALAGSDVGSSRYVRVNATTSGAQFDLYVYGRDYDPDSDDNSGGATRAEAVTLDLGTTELGAISLSGTEQWYRVDNVTTLTFRQQGDVAAAGDMEFSARVYVGESPSSTLNGDGDVDFGAPTNNVYIQVRSFNDTRAAAAGDARFTITPN